MSDFEMGMCAHVLGVDYQICNYDISFVTSLEASSFYIVSEEGMLVQNHDYTLEYDPTCGNGILRMLRPTKRCRILVYNNDGTVKTTSTFDVVKSVNVMYEEDVEHIALAHIIRQNASLHVLLHDIQRAITQNDEMHMENRGEGNADTEMVAPM